VDGWRNRYMEIDGYISGWNMGREFFKNIKVKQSDISIILFLIKIAR
jgi:hypothetical protein